MTKPTNSGGREHSYDDDGWCLNEGCMWNGLSMETTFCPTKLPKRPETLQEARELLNLVRGVPQPEPPQGELEAARRGQEAEIMQFAEDAVYGKESELEQRNLQFLQVHNIVADIAGRAYVAGVSHKSDGGAPSAHRKDIDALLALLAREYSRGFEAAGKTNWAIQQKLEEKAYSRGYKEGMAAHAKAIKALSKLEKGQEE